MGLKQRFIAFLDTLSDDADIVTPTAKAVSIAGAQAMHDQAVKAGAVCTQSAAKAKMVGSDDVMFAINMIDHHEDALNMANEILASGSDPAILALANDIIVSQTKQIDFLSGWLSKNNISDEGAGAMSKAAIVSNLLIDAHISKEVGQPLVFIASGAYQDKDQEWASKEMLGNMAAGINDGSITMSLDWFHTGFKSRSNKTPSAEPIILGHIAKAAFENDHLALMPVFDDPAHEDIVRKEADTLGLSIWFGGVARDEDRAFRGKPSSRVSVALTPRGYESYPYTAIRQE